TINNGPLATIGGLLTYIKGLRPAGKLGAAFGAYGWGGGSQKVIEEALTQASITLEVSGLSLQWKASEEELKRCFDFGVQFGNKIKQEK
ncbi:MAG: fprA, partial [Firmicutes bacterium]|nr:fprA [Bacillota bacterium]